ncbi:MAG: hypothetical protein IT534_10480 [Bauldia sp.]|nr:hypothetical protein [Bauldia sp.]
MPLGTILTTVAAYVAIAILLLSLNLTSRWRWWIKGAAIVITGAFFAASYFAIVGMFGWPTEERLPERFSLIATHVEEPDRFIGTDGAVFLWVRRIDDNNVPVGPPRSYQIVYTEPLAEAADDAQERLDAGETVEGRLDQLPPEEPAEEAGGTPVDRAGNAGYEVDFTLQFNDMPIVNLPEKGVL